MSLFACRYHQTWRRGIARDRDYRRYKQSSEDQGRTGTWQTELELKYGCNPNQKPARIFMEDGGELPIKVLNGKPGYINFLDAFNSWQLVKELKEATGLPAAASFKHVSPAGAAVGTAPDRTLKQDLLCGGHGALAPWPAPMPGPGARTGMCSYGDWAALSDVCDDDTARYLAAGGVRRRHRPRLHRRGPGHPEDQAQGQLQRGADRPRTTCPRPWSTRTCSASPLSRAATS